MVGDNKSSSEDAEKTGNEEGVSSSDMVISSRSCQNFNVDLTQQSIHYACTNIRADFE